MNNRRDSPSDTRVRLAIESCRDCRRARSLRGWTHGTTDKMTLRDCTTRAPFGAFNSLVTFHRGGTLSESTSSPGAVGQHGSGSGNWAPAEDHTYSQRLVALMNFDTPANLPGTPGFDPTLPVSPAFFAGWSTVTQTVTLTNADRARSSGTNTFFKADGTPYASGCSTAVLTRFE